MLEFHEKLQKLRKEKGLTQEELARKLYVSRTAISKWESGRGYPGIESLKAIAAYFSVSVDELLSEKETLAFASEAQKEKERYFRTLICGALDLGMVMLLFLPFFGQRTDTAVSASSLIALTDISAWLKSAYFIILLCLFLFGILTLALQNCDRAVGILQRISFLFGAVLMLLFILNRQPYAVIFALALWSVKAFVLLKRQ